MGSSPVIAKDAVIVVCDHEGESVIMAFNKTSGETLWRQPRDESSGWTTPVVVEVDGQLQVIVNGTNAKQPLEGLNQIYASFVGVGDRIYVEGRNGAVAVLNKG